MCIKNLEKHQVSIGAGWDVIEKNPGLTEIMRELSLFIMTFRGDRDIPEGGTLMVRDIDEDIALLESVDLGQFVEKIGKLSTTIPIQEDVLMMTTVYKKLLPTLGLSQLEESIFGKLAQALAEISHLRFSVLRQLDLDEWEEEAYGAHIVEAVLKNNDFNPQSWGGLALGFAQSITLVLGGEERENAPYLTFFASGITYNSARQEMVLSDFITNTLTRLRAECDLAFQTEFQRGDHLTVAF